MLGFLIRLFKRKFASAELAPALVTDDPHWWRQNYVLARMERDAENYRQYLLGRVSKGEPIWLATYIFNGQKVTFVLCGDSEDAAVLMALPSEDYHLTCGVIEPHEGETVSGYVDRCLAHQFQVVS